MGEELRRIERSLEEIKRYAFLDDSTIDFALWHLLLSQQEKIINNSDDILYFRALER